MTTSNSTPCRPLAIVAGVLFTGGALYILLDDAIRHNTYTMDHAVTVLTVLGTIATGHLAASARHWLATPAFWLLFLAGTCLTVYTSVGRQAEVSDTKALSTEAQNAAIAVTVSDLDRARLRLSQANAQADREMTGERCGGRCQDWKLRAREVAANVTAIETKLAVMGPQKPVASKADKMAKVLALFGFSEPKAKAALMLLEPFAYALFFELGSILSLGYGFRPDAREFPAKKQFPEPETEPETEKSTPKATHPVLRVLHSASRPLTNDELAARMGVTKGESSKRRGEVAHLLQERRQGRYTLVSLAH